MKAKTILSYALVLLLGTGVGFFVGNSVSEKGENTNKSKNKGLKAEDCLEWTHIDLLKYFQSKGFDFKAEASDIGRFWGTPMDFKNENGEVLYVRLHETTEKSKSKASGLGTEGFSWGKFMFCSDSEELLKNISAILDNKYNDDFEFLKSTVSTQSTEETQKIEQKQITSKIKLEKVNTGYYTGDRIWAPCVVLTFKNVSNQDITDDDYTAIEVVFFNETENEQLSAVKKYLIGVATNTRLSAGNTRKIHFTSDLGWTKIPFGTKIVAKIYVEKTFIKTVDINEFEISLLGKRLTLYGEEDF